MTESENKKYIKSFIQENINEYQFNKRKVCNNHTYKKVINNTIGIINTFDKDNIDFHMMLCDYIKKQKIKLVDQENFAEMDAQSFIYHKDILSIINID
jgi:hypothetical protein